MTTCAWLKKYVFTAFGSQGVKLANALEDVQPSGDDTMPVLLALANSAKYVLTLLYPVLFTEVSAERR
jgi:hypothetical protein